MNGCDVQDDWAHFPYFLAAARQGSLRLAADALDANHATVDRHIRALEHRLGARLFDRVSTGLVLTSAGQALVPLAEQAEAALTAARRRLSGLDGQATGTVRISMPPVLAQTVMPPMIAEFSAMYPDIDLSVHVTNRFENLANAERDVSLRVAYSVEDDVVGRRLVTYTQGIYAAQGYLDAHWGRRGDKGAGLHWIGWGDRDAVPAWVRDSPFPSAQIRHSMREAYLVAELVRCGVGMSYLPDFMAAQLPGVVRVPGTVSAPDRSIWLLLHADLRQTTRVRLFVDHVAAAFAKLRPQFEAQSG